MIDRARLTMADARDLPHQDLLERLESILADYDAAEVETEGQKLLRLNRTLDEMPAVYRWFLQLESWLDHWTDAMAQQLGRGDITYKLLRQRRDLMKTMASAAKMRYESSSRQITLLMEFDPTGMPRTRRE